MSKPDEDLSAIDPALLDAVTGGTATNEQITEALQQIQNTLKDMNKPSSSTNWLQQLLPLLLFSRGGLFNQFSTQLSGGCPCGCGGGMGLCRRR